MIDAPLLMLELREMHERFTIALMTQSDSINQIIQSEVNALCTVEYLQKIVKEKAEHVIPSVIEDEIDSFYRHGKGRKAIHAAVIEKLSNENY